MNGLAASQSASRRVRLFAWMLFVFWSLASLVSWGWGHAWPAEVQAEMGQAHAWSARPAIMHVMLWMVGAAGIWLGGNWMQRGNRQRDAAVRTLQENERKTRAVIDHAPDAILIHDKGGRIIEANPSVCAATGYTRQELLGMSLQGLDPGAALDSSQAGYWERLGEEQPPAVEITLRRKDGTRVPVEAILTTIEMAEGTCVLASMRSIAERKRAEAEREAFARLAMRLSACSSVKSIIKVVQEESRALLQWDAHYFAVRDQSEDRLVVLYYMDTVGGRLQEFPGEPWPTFPSDETWDLLGGKPCLLNRPTTAMEPSMVPFGDTARLSASLLDVPVCSGNRVIGILSVQSYTPNRYTVSDMYTLEQFARALAPALERAYAEQAFRDSEERFRTLAAATFEGIAITEHGRYIDVNEQFAGLLGYEVAELIGMSVEQVVAPEYREAGMQNGCEMLKEGQLLCKDGSRRTVESHGRTMTYHGREVRITAIRDITERNRAEAALRESESQFRTMFELAAVGMGQADPATGRLVRVNDRLCSMLGYTATELVGRRFSDFTHPEDRAHDWELFSRAARGETLEYRHQKRDVRKDGTIIWVDVNVGFIRDAAGHTLRTIAAILDITDRKRAEALLTTRVRLSELAQRTTLDELMQAAVDEAENLTDSRLGFLHFVEEDQEHLSLQAWSTRTLQGACNAEGKGRHYSISEAGVWVDCFHARSAVMHNDYERLPHKKGMPTGHVAVIRELAVPIVRNDRVIAILGVGNKATDYTQEDAQLLHELASQVMDLVSNKQFEDALRDSEQRFRTLAAATFEGIAISENARFTDVNEQLARMLGYEPSELIGARVDTLLGPEDREWVLDNLRTGETSFREHRLICKDGTRRVVEVNGRTVAHQGRSVRLTAFHDLTARKQAEERNNELAEALRQSQKLQAIGQLAGGVAHNFNNLLLAISGNTEAIVEYVAKQPASGDREHCLHAADQLGQAVKMGTTLTRRLLAFCRKQPIRPVSIDANETIRGMFEMLRGVLKPEIRFELEEGEDTGCLYTDAGQLEESVLNLVINARDAMPEGGHLVVRTRRTVLDEAAAAQKRLLAGPYVCISVSDTGEGIDAQTRTRLFEPFFTTKPLGQGAGLGLPMVYGFVTQAGGSIEVESQVGQGTIFTLLLPATDESPGNDRPAHLALPRPKPAGETILLCEDDPMIRQLITRYLSSNGYTVIETSDAESALEFAGRRETPVDVLVSDLELTGMNGAELAHQLSSRWPSLRCLLVSGHPQSTWASGVELGPEMSFLSKPFQLADLLHAIQKLLARP